MAYHDVFARDVQFEILLLLAVDFLACFWSVVNIFFREYKARRMCFFLARSLNVLCKPKYTRSLLTPLPPATILDLIIMQRTIVCAIQVNGVL